MLHSQRNNFSLFVGDNHHPYVQENHLTGFAVIEYAENN
jgi:hypothetical protein